MTCIMLGDDLLRMPTKKNKNKMLNPKSKVAMFKTHLYGSKKIKASKCHYIFILTM